MEEKKHNIILKGICGSPGLVEGKVWIIRNPEKRPTKIKKNCIVVVKYTSPVLAVALKFARAIICEMGTTTSHAAVISREWGIPCLVSVKDALTILNNEDWIIVDADKGKIYRSYLD
ncbi:MAG: PEP-utilizing enzyme [Patescibacteria group bacterium]